MFEKYEYGETLENCKIRNLRGKLFRHYHTGGLLLNETFDFKGNILISKKQVLKDFKKTPNWSEDLDLEPEVFASEISYDALNRTVRDEDPG